MADPESEESIKALWESFEFAPKRLEWEIDNISPYTGDLESDYK